MTTYTMRAEPAPTNEVDDLISSLDAEFGKSAPKQRSAPRAKAPAPVEPVYVQMWFPDSIVMHGSQTRCECCENVWESIDGLYLQDRHKNGATRQQRTTFDCIPDDYLEFAARTEWKDETVAACPICLADQIKHKRDRLRERQEADLHELIRSIPLDPEDNIKTQESSDAAQ